MDQGVWSSQAARTAVRKQMARDFANHPELTKELTQLYQDTLSKTGLGSVVVEGTDQEKLQREAQAALYKDAQKNGFVSADAPMDSPEAQSGIMSWQSYNLHAKQLEQSQAELSYKRGLVGYDTDVVQLASAKQSYVTGGITQKTARLNLYEKQAEVRDRAAINGGAAAFQKVFSDKLNDTWTKFKNGQLTAQEASLAIDQDAASIQALATQTAPNAGGDYIRNVLSPMQSVASSMKDALSGKLDADALQNEFNALVTKQTLMSIHQNPDVLPVIATSKAMGDVPPQIMAKFTTDAFKMIGFNAQTGDFNGANVLTQGGAAPNGRSSATGSRPKLPDVTGVNQDNKAAMSYIKATMENVLSGTTKDPEAIKEVNNSLNTAIASLNKYGPTTDTPAELYEVLNIIASPSFAQYSKKYFTMDREQADAAREVMQNYYTDKALPIIREEYNKGLAYTGEFVPSSISSSSRGAPVDERVPATNVIDLVFDGQSMQFKAKDPTNRAVAVKVKDLNKDTKRTLNLILHANANLTGNSLAKVAAELKDQIAPTPGITSMYTPKEGSGRIVTISREEWEDLQPAGPETK